MERSNKPFKPSIQPHWHTIHPLLPLQQPYKNIHGGSYGLCVPNWSRWHIVILFVDNSQIKIYFKKTGRLKMGKNLNHIRLVTNNQRAKKIGQVQTKVCKKIPSIRIYKMLQNNIRFTKCCKRTTPHCSTSLAWQCLTSLIRWEAVLSLWYGRSCWKSGIVTFIKLSIKDIDYWWEGSHYKLHENKMWMLGPTSNWLVDCWVTNKKRKSKPNSDKASKSQQTQNQPARHNTWSL